VIILQSSRSPLSGSPHRAALFCQQTCTTCRRLPECRVSLTAEEHGRRCKLHGVNYEAIKRTVSTLWRKRETGRFLDRAISASEGTGSFSRVSIAPIPSRGTPYCATLLSCHEERASRRRSHAHAALSHFKFADESFTPPEGFRSAMGIAVKLTRGRVVDV